MFASAQRESSPNLCGLRFGHLWPSLGVAPSLGAQIQLAETARARRIDLTNPETLEPGSGLFIPAGP